MKALIGISIVLVLIGTGLAVRSQEKPATEPAVEPGDSTAVGDAEIMGPPVLGAEARHEEREEGEAEDAGEAEPADSGSAPGAKREEERAGDADVTPPGGEEAPEGAGEEGKRAVSPGVPYTGPEVPEGPPAPGEAGRERAGAEGDREPGPDEAPPPAAAPTGAAEALPPGGEIMGPPRAVSEDRSARYGYTLTLKSYRPKTHIRFRPPEFREDPDIEYDFDAAIDEIWLDHASRRTYEAEERSLSDFSEIDIPIKFPDTIGRVIGQGANLSVSGSEQITFGGQSSYIVDEKLTERGSKSKFPQLDMKQHLKIDLNGTVGEKIHVGVHHDSEVQTPLENRIKLRYEGYDDEIVQSVEMGNTNLSIPGSQFVSYSGQHQGLFGAKMVGKMGPVDFTAIMSKQEGQTASSRFEGAAKKDSVVLYDTDFLRDRFFFIINPEDIKQGYTIVDVQVYLDDGIGTNNEGEGVIDAYPFVNAAPLDSLEWAEKGFTYPGKFSLLERNRDYALNDLTGGLDLTRALSEEHTLAVAYVYSNGETTEQVGGLDEENRLILKMIRLPYNDYQADTEYWQQTIRLERKNVYSLRASFVSEQGVEAEIYRIEAGTGGDNLQGQYQYRKIMGLDLYDEEANPATEANGWATDDYVDPGRIYGDIGLLEFPDLQPFAPGTYPAGTRPADLEDQNPVIYNTHYRELSQDIKSHQKYYMVVRYSTPQATFNLGRMNILQGSEVVMIDGRRLVRGTDYDIYYDIGQIRFKTEEAADPNAKITIDYEYVPLISFAQEFLGGLQGVYSLADRSHVATVWLYQSRKSPEERPRLGQEPSSLLMGDLNAQFGWRPYLMTSMMNALPIVRANEPSKLDISGEIAASFPNPNTKDDVYVDDMEGVSETRSYSMTRESWVPASPPTNYDWPDNRGMWWYLKDREVTQEDIFPDAESRPGEAFIPVLEMDIKGFKYPEGGSADPAQQWSGLMRLISRAGADYSRLKFLEVWIRQKSGDGTATMNVDLGSVSEDFYRPWLADVLHTEDKDNDGELLDTENTGLDGVFTGTEGDDPDDDYFFDDNVTGAERYAHINGYEEDPSRIPQTEDLSGDGNLDVTNTHFRFSFDISEDSPYFTKRSNDWYNFRVPLEVADSLGGSPNWISTRYIRFFLTNIDSADVFQMAYLQVVGTSWLEEGLRDAVTMEWVPPAAGELYGLATKNTTDDPDYNPPYDPGKDPDGFSKREQSLVFRYIDLQPGNMGPAYRTMASPEDYTTYQTLSYYVHGDLASADQDIYHYTRFGADSVNFYEYAVKVEPGWQTVEISFDDITNLKLEDADSVTIYGVEKVPVRKVAVGGGWMAVYGEPSITRIARITGGVMNLGGAPADGEVWFDDIRLTDVRREPGYASRVSMGASFSDVLTLSADVKRTDTEFTTRGAKRKGSDDTNVTLSASTKVDRFLPDIGISLPLNARYTKARSVPTLKSKSDIALEEDQRRAESTTRESESYSLNISRPAKSRNLFMKLTMDLMNVNVSMSRKRDRTPEFADTNITYNGNFNYSLRPWWKHSLTLFKGYAVAFMPDVMDLKVYGSVNDTKKVNLRKGVVTTDKYTRVIKSDINIGVKPLTGRALDTDYSFKMTRDLDTNKNVAIPQSIGLGQEIQRSQRYLTRITPTVGRWLRPTFAYDGDYAEDSGPTVREGGDPPGVRRVSSSSRASVDFIVSPEGMFKMPAPGDTVGISWLKRTVSRLPDINMSYLLDRKSRYYKLTERPDLAYQFGFTVYVPEELNYSLSSTAQRRDEITRRDGLNVSTDFRPFQALNVSVKYKNDKTRQERSGGTTYKETSTWPDVSANVSSAFYSALFGGALTNSSLNFGYKTTTNLDGENESSITREDNTTDFVPLVGWDATWKNGVRTTFNIRHSSGESNTFLAAASRKTTKTTSVNISVKHSFSAPQGISFAGRTLRFKSNLSLSMDVTYETKLNRTPEANITDLHTSRFSLIPKLSYSFSKSITGSANARFEQISNKKLNETRRTIGVNVSVLIKF
ncbi:MAG: cell surface protein SprA [bacterium]|jgi:hypothetical protein